ncbi:hypothetical protein [Natronomonas amylolytica]|uniref:hypothetical protein n=1 Tax=Natronomonas amylolytica TaxID=3108498 RepID=UPI00300BADC2
MKEETNHADQSAHADEDIVLEAQTLRRLNSIQKADESCDDVLTRLLDNAVKNVPIEEIMTDLLDQFEEAVSINVELPPQHPNPGKMFISVHTGNVGLEEYVSLYDGTESRAVIESNAGDQFCLLFDVIATCDGPKMETMSTTPIYATNSILGTDSISLDEGLDQLRSKIGKPSEELRDLVNDY